MQEKNENLKEDIVEIILVVLSVLLVSVIFFGYVLVVQFALNHIIEYFGLPIRKLDLE